ncbi:N-acetylmuramoyl-L-alanine amidase [Lachnospiraceae bacterium KM106-2]|nr:N-acetylmuramoyl-L-alanine amidase [Lachnospiraceae bacterium KM106-2]
MKKYRNIIFLVLVVLSILLFANPSSPVFLNQGGGKNKKKPTVVVDAGHGGFDPGKIGVNKALEKDINLKIAKKLERILKKNKYKVIMTRTNDTGLYEPTDRNKKSVDLRKRVAIINDNDIFLAVSIHQNSFTQQSSKGAQVFYHASSEGGKILAEIIQEQIKASINDGNHRVAKSNESYYMLKKTKCPLVIVECGFLSNPSEAELLLKDDYQEQMAEAIYQGIDQYTNKVDR